MFVGVVMRSRRMSVLDRDLDVMEEGVTAEEPKTRDSETHYITVKIKNIQTPHEAPR